MKAQFTRWGIAHDYRGAHVTLRWRGRTLIGTVTDIYRDDVRGCTHFKVRHFNGEPWPIDPGAGAVEILERPE